MVEVVRRHRSHSRTGRPEIVRRFTRPSRMNFKSRAAYRKWLAYDAIHNPKFGKHPVEVDIRGRKIKSARHIRRR
jgi:hypothetical protein